jgi:uncharacterized protein (TIGR00266 family)
MAEAYTNIPGQRLDIPDPSVAMSGKTMGGSNFRIVGTTLQVLIFNLERGNKIYTERGAMSWMTDGVSMSTNMGGGIGGLFKRAFAGESLFVVDYEAQRDSTEIAFSSEFPGKIIPVNLAQGQSMIAQRDSFLVAEKSVNLGIHFNRKISGSIFGGEGLILQKFDGPGTFFAAFDGEIVEYTLQPGQVLKVDTGHVAMFEPTVTFDIEMVKGIKNIFFGGEGLFLARLTGPGRIWLQTMPMTKLATALSPYMATTSSSSSGGTAGGIIGNLLSGD